MERTHRRVHSSWRRCSPPHRAIGWYRPTLREISTPSGFRQGISTTERFSSVLFTSISASDGALYVGGVHGMEWLTTLLLFRFTEDLLRAIATGPAPGSPARCAGQSRHIGSARGNRCPPAVPSVLGRNPLPVEELEPIYARLLEMLLISILL